MHACTYLKKAYRVRESHDRHFSTEENPC